MKPLLYAELVPWYRLLDPVEEHADEAAAYQAALEAAVEPRPETLLELGAGAGNNAFHLKARFRCTLTDLSDDMLALSRAINPECEHIQGDMRALRLGRTFDVVLVHDAVMYMATEADLEAAAATAFAHTRPGGAALFAPDHTGEQFSESTELHEGDDDDGGRSLRCMMWSWDPDPDDTSFVTEFAFLLREGTTVTAVHDRHVEGLFSSATWQRILSSVGFVVELVSRGLDEPGYDDDVFVCRRPL